MHYKLSGLSPENETSLQRGELLPLMEEFYTIQGEGYNTGKAAYFIRIGGCDVGCHWCDVKESWDASLHPLTTTETIINNVINSRSKAVVVTGGEPLQYNLDTLTALLKKNNIQTFIETSGAYPLSGSWDWICLSPKKTMLPTEDNYRHAHELKVIVHNKHDFIWAEEQAKKVNKDCYLFLQPEWSKRQEMMPLIVDYVMKNQHWMISLQTHKYMNIP
ncbi:MAG: 7-carboxy-7-deazaguanine synthase QueE [Bacteroidetes bacterium]|nr:7-carboxy-7-deazaguanine synthase QueE [Bacteroidota bacterium]